jgi:3-oxoadipate enol-lactonase
MVTLPGRGDLWVWDVPGPPGAPTVVLLHGWTSTAALNWCACFEELSTVFRVIAPDHRGHGRGIMSREPFRLEDCADDVAALIDVLDVGPVTAVGYSMGGPIASLLWRRHPDHVDGLVLCATAARFGGRPELAPAITALGRGLAIAFERIPVSLVREGVAQVARIRRRSNDEPDPQPWVVAEMQGGNPPALIQAGAALNAYDATGWVPDIDAPTAVVVTTRDRTVSPERQWWLARNIPGAMPYTVQSDHRACVDAAKEFVPILLDACQHVTNAGQSRRQHLRSQPDPAGHHA